MFSLGYVVVVLLSASVLHEHVEWLFAAPGLTCIVAGVSLIGLGRVEEEREGSGESHPPAGTSTGTPEGRSGH
jgi:hypothetical protein